MSIKPNPDKQPYEPKAPRDQTQQEALQCTTQCAILPAAARTPGGQQRRVVSKTEKGTTSKNQQINRRTQTLKRERHDSYNSIGKKTNPIRDGTKRTCFSRTRHRCTFQSPCRAVWKCRRQEWRPRDILSRDQSAEHMHESLRPRASAPRALHVRNSRAPP